MSGTIPFECCEYPMEVCDETITDCETSNLNRASTNICHVHQKQVEIYYCSKLDLPDDVLNTNNDIIIPIYYTKLKLLTSMQNILVYFI